MNRRLFSMFSAWNPSLQLSSKFGVAAWESQLHWPEETPLWSADKAVSESGRPLWAGIKSFTSWPSKGSTKFILASLIVQLKSGRPVNPAVRCLVRRAEWDVCLHFFMELSSRGRSSLGVMFICFMCFHSLLVLLWSYPTMRARSGL